jgi:hypothetical protein
MQAPVSVLMATGSGAPTSGLWPPHEDLEYRSLIVAF